MWLLHFIIATLLIVSNNISINYDMTIKSLLFQTETDIVDT